MWAYSQIESKRNASFTQRCTVCIPTAAIVKTYYRPMEKSLVNSTQGVLEKLHWTCHIAHKKKHGNALQMYRGGSEV